MLVERACECSGLGLGRRIENREYPHRVISALDADQIQLRERFVRHLERRRFAEDEIDAIGLAGALEPRGEIHGIPKHRVLHALVRAHIADAALPGVDADADPEW